MAKASGREYIDHKSQVLDHISEHFNNPDISDVTLTVGHQVYSAHRFVLSAQSQVFHTMLMGKNWKESEERKVTLEESPVGEAGFSDFLKYFYTGKLTLTSENVCGIHTLADKYDVTSLRDACLGFMKDVLTGVHGDAFESAFGWLDYIERFTPDLLATCHSAIRTNFVACHKDHKKYEGKLTFDQIKSIVSFADAEEDFVVENEDSFLVDLISLCIDMPENGRKCLPLIRFYNMTPEDLQNWEKESDLTFGKYCSEAYKIQAERDNCVKKACKKRRRSKGSVDVTCSCDASSPCRHINPRFYLKIPYGYLDTMGDPWIWEPIDLADLQRFSQRLQSPEDSHAEKEWVVESQGNYTGDPICEKYKVKPALCHVGRRYSLAIVGVKLYEDNGKQMKYRYTIKNKGKVTKTGGHGTDVITLSSPLRDKGSWEMDEFDRIGVSILLHK
ncbi:BTB/POZ domain-containing protein 9-like [Amphiura filiformis]|uniref:BTB/POZ domain-containing protein 9-like n=1 Tax=Amphiura filiformis TaxID=82378 RepID=UPI003B228277